jgi:hypothetical protein
VAKGVGVRRVTPANVLPTLVAFVLASVLGLPGGSPTGTRPTGSAGPALSAPVLSAPALSARVHAAPQARAEARTPAPASGRISTAVATVRVTQTGTPPPGHPGPGAALAALAYRLSIDRLGRLLASPAGRHPAGVDFSSFRSRAPPLTS